MFEYCKFIPTNHNYFNRPYMEDFKRPFYIKALENIVVKREAVLNTSLIRYNFNITQLNANDTIDSGSTSTNQFLTAYDIIIPVIGALVILANACVVVSSGLILTKDQQPKSTYLFLGNVAMTDMLTGISVIFGNLYPHSKRNQSVCAIQLGMIVSATLTSIYSVGLIAVDRYLYILYGLKYSHYIYPNRARSLIVTTWLIGIIIGFLPLMGWSGDTNNGQICWFTLLAPTNLILLTISIGVVPILVVIVLYSIILHHALRKIIQLQESNDKTADAENSSSNHLRIFRGRSNPTTTSPEEQPKKILKCFKTNTRTSNDTLSKWKAIKVVLFTTSSFVVTWTPYFVASIIFATNCTMEDTSQMCKTLRLLIASPFAILGFLNSLINPIIYAWWHNGFRRFVKDRFRRVSKKVRFSKEVSKTTSTRSLDNP